MRYICRSCRHEVDESAASCRNCDALLDSRSRIALGEIGLDAVVAAPEGSAPDRSVKPRQVEQEPSEAEQSAGIISGTDKSTAANRLPTGPGSGPSRGLPGDPPAADSRGDGSQAGTGARSRKRARKPAKRQRRPGGRPYGPVRPDVKPQVADIPEPVPHPNSSPAAASGSGPPPFGGGTGPGGNGGPAGTVPGGAPGTRLTPTSQQQPSQSCPSCGVDNAQDANFCTDCRQPLKVSKTAQQIVQQVGRDPWYRRALGTTRFRGADNRLWGQRLRDRNLGSSLRHSSGMAPKTRLGLGAAALVIVGLLVLLLGPLRRPIVEVFSPPSDPVPFNVTLGGDAPEVEATLLDRLSDGSTQVALEIPWQEILPPYACGDRQAFAIRFDFTDGEIPKRLRLYVAKDPVDDGELAALWPGPKLVSVGGKADCTGPEEVDTEEGWVSYDVESLIDERDPWLEFYIHTRWEDPAVGSNDVVVIAEVSLLR